MLPNLRNVLARLGAAATLLLAVPAQAEWGLNMTEGVTPISRDVFGLHMTIFYICCAIGVVVFGAMFWSILMHRKSRGAEADQFHHNGTVEVMWTVVPFAILVLMAIPATRTLIAIEDTGDAEMTIKVTGYQWKWHYDYLEEGIQFFSNLDPESNAARQLDSGVDPSTVENYLLEVDNRVVVPTETKIRFLTTAADVIHAWWMPDLGWKRDAIPGFINSSWAYIEKPGVYRGQCAELCGKDHGFMPVVLEAMPKDEYRAWVEAQKGEADAAAATSAAADIEWDLDNLMAEGEAVYGQACASCHQADGQGIPGAFPAIAGSAIAAGDISEHINIVLNGKSGTAMAAFRDQLTNEQVAAVVTYQRNAFGNDTEDEIYPEEVAVYR